MSNRIFKKFIAEKLRLASASVAQIAIFSISGAWRDKSIIKQTPTAVEDKLKLMVKRAEKRAKVKNVNFNITWEDVEYVDACPILEIPLNWGETTNEGGRNIDTPSLDRINPSLGYIKGNVRIISTLANMMKSSANREQIQAFCKNIFKYLDNEEIVRTVEKGESAEVQDKELV